MHTLATGWFHPSDLEGIWSPSTHWRTSFHQGVLGGLWAVSCPVAAACKPSQSSIHLAHLLDMRALIQSIVLAARSSSASRHPSSISANSEKRRAKAVRGTGVNDIVRVVTSAYVYESVGRSGTWTRGILTLGDR